MPVDVDAQRLVATVNEWGGAGLTELGTAAHGATGGAVYVRWPDGHGSVLTRSHASLIDLERTGQVLRLARSRGLPVPRIGACGCSTGRSVDCRHRKRTSSYTSTLFSPGSDRFAARSGDPIRPANRCLPAGARDIARTASRGVAVGSWPRSGRRQRAADWGTVADRQSPALVRDTVG